MADRRTSPRRRAAALATVIGLLLVAGCGSEAADPDAERLERVEQRLGSSFSATQADCILDALDDASLVALDLDEPLPADSKALAAYTEAVRSCVTEGAATTSTTPAPTTTAGS